jgi:hypothetical protein
VGSSYNAAMTQKPTKPDDTGADFNETLKRMLNTPPQPKTPKPKPKSKKTRK